jgi:hypothetical protein
MIYRIDDTLARDQANWFVLALVLFALTIHYLRDYEALEHYRYTIAVVGIGLLGAGHLGDPVLIGALLLTLASTRLVLAIKSASIPTVLGSRDLMQGNSISQAGSAVFQIVGAAIALVGTKIASAGLVVAGGACVYAVGAIVGSRVGRLEERKRTTRFGQEVGRIVRDVRDGVRELGRRPTARLGLFSFLALRGLVSFVALVFALEVRQILGGASSKQALLIAAAAGAFGAGIGFVAAQVLKDRVQPQRLIIGSSPAQGPSRSVGSRRSWGCRWSRS